MKYDFKNNTEQYRLSNPPLFIQTFIDIINWLLRLSIEFILFSLLP